MERMGREVLDRRRKQRLDPQKRSLVISCDSSRTRTFTLARRSSIDIIRRKMNKTSLFMTVAQVNAMLTKMVFIICVFSFFEHLFLIMGLYMYTDFSYSFKLDIFFCTNLSMFSKNSINIFIFYNFNAFFKKRFNLIFTKD